MRTISLEHLDGLHLTNSNSRAKEKTAERSMRVPPIVVVTDQDQFLGYPTQSTKLHFLASFLGFKSWKATKQI